MHILSERPAKLNNNIIIIIRPGGAATAQLESVCAAVRGHGQDVCGLVGVRKLGEVFESVRLAALARARPTYNPLRISAIDGTHWRSSPGSVQLFSTASLYSVVVPLNP